MLLTNSKNYSMLIQLLGIETWATNDIISTKLTDMGFINVTVSFTTDPNQRLAQGTWNGSDGVDTTYFPPEIIDIQELP